MCSNCYVTIAAKQLGISNLSGKRLKNVKNSEVSDYLFQCRSFDILANNFRKLRLLLKGGLLIKRGNPV